MPWRARAFGQRQLRQRAGRPQLKRDPLGSRSSTMTRIVEVRKLAAVDMAWLGTRIIVVEYAFGVVAPLALGIQTLRHTWLASSPSTSQLVLGFWLLGIATNYVPLFLYAVSLARSGTAKAEGAPELPRARPLRGTAVDDPRAIVGSGRCAHPRAQSALMRAPSIPRGTCSGCLTCA